MMNHDIFISYSNKQKSIADKVCLYLEQKGLKCWIAPRDIPVGSDYADLIETAIKACKVVVLVYSETSAISKWVKGEINVAFSENKHILPFRIDNTEIKGSIRIMLSQTHWIDAFPNYYDQLPSLLESICGIINKQTKQINNIDKKNIFDKLPKIAIGIIITATLFVTVFMLLFHNKDATISNNKDVISYTILLPYNERLEIPQTMKKLNEQIIIEYKGFTINYNPTWLIPNWVAYELNVEDVVIHHVARNDKFLPDPYVNGKCSTSEDYKDSGYDRGHMVPAGDMKWDATAMEESFYTTNVCPQNHNLNAGLWKELEEQVRNWAIKNEKVYVVCGPIMKHKYESIGENNEAVPSSFFKVVLMYRNNNWRALGFVFANEACNQPLDTYARSIRQVEKITGFDFFSALPDDIENEIEKNYSFDAFEN